MSFGAYYNNRGKCPHCLNGVEFVPASVNSGGIVQRAKYLTVDSKGEQHNFEFWECPTCEKLIIKESRVNKKNNSQSVVFMLYPLASQRQPVPQEVPAKLAKMYEEATLVLPFSEEASAALSRRCLQAVLLDAGKVTSKDLAPQIDEVLPQLPTYLKTQVDAVRNIGNFGAHPNKSKASGEIIEVEVGEAEWNLDVLDALFDFYYVQPAKISASSFR